jgi:hypothetical protein
VFTAEIMEIFCSSSMTSLLLEKALKMNEISNNSYTCKIDSKKKIVSDKSQNNQSVIKTTYKKTVDEYITAVTDASIMGYTYLWVTIVTLKIIGKELSRY